MYIILKHIHLTTIAVSVLLLLIRFFWLMKDNPMLEKKWVKVLPHIVDTLLLASAVGLMMTLQQYPFVNAWLTEKLLLVIAYIVSGAVALKIAKTTPVRVGALFGCLVFIAMIGKIAVFKQPLLLG